MLNWQKSDIAHRILHSTLLIQLDEYRKHILGQIEVEYHIPTITNLYSIKIVLSSSNLKLNSTTTTNPYFQLITVGRLNLLPLIYSVEHNIFSNTAKLKNSEGQVSIFSVVLISHNLQVKQIVSNHLYGNYSIRSNKNLVWKSHF